MLDRAKRVQHTAFKQRGRGHVPHVGQCGGTGHQHRIDQAHSDPLPTARVGMRLDPGTRWAHISLTMSDDVGAVPGSPRAIGYNLLSVIASIGHMLTSVCHAAC